MKTVRPLTANNRFMVVTMLSVTWLLGGCGKTESPENAAWFGLTPPPGLGDPHSSIVDVSGVKAPPAAVPAGEEGFTELQGDKIFVYVRDIVEFSKQSRAAGDKVWGRVSGFPAQQKTAAWVAEQFRAAGLQDVELQQYSQDSDMWWSNQWQVTLKGKPLFGDGSDDIVLETALPTSGSFIENGTLTGQPIYAGAVGEALPIDTDVTGKIAVQEVNPERSAYTERTPTRERAQALMAQGAIAVINIVNQSGNMLVRDFSNCNGPCFNLGTADGAFLLAAMQQADANNQLAELQMELSLQAQDRSDLSAYNAMGIIPGDNNDELIIINAHTDSWFDGAGDNADGLAILVAMARHFSQQENKPARSLLFVASGGHHSSGLNGPAHFVAMNPALVNKAVLVLNLEHNAQLFINDDWQAEPTEQMMSWSISNDNPWLADLTRRAMQRYGFNLNPEFRSATPGDLGGYRQLGIPMHQAIHSGALYHTSGDVLETISIPGLERAARFQTYFIDQVAQAGRNLFDSD